MDINDWMEAMQVAQLKSWVQAQLAPTRLEAINERAIELLKVRANADFQIFRSCHITVLI